MHENEPRHNETWSERTDILPITWRFILGQCKRAKKAGERWKSVQAKENGRKGRTCKRLSKHLSQPTSRKTASHVRMASVKMSKFAVLEAFTRSPTFFFVSACAKPRRDGNKNLVSRVNLCSSSLYGDYSYPLTLSNEGELSWNWILRDHIEAQEEK